MTVVVAMTATEVFEQTVKMVMSVGDRTTPRGRPTIEVPGATIWMFDPLSRIVATPSRGLSLVKLLGRLIWELTARNDLGSIAYYDDQALRFADKQTAIIPTAYGFRIKEQIDEVVGILKKDPDSRRAVAVILDPATDDMGTRLEYPCAISTQFMIRDGRLTCITSMRSQSVWGVLPYDIALFTIFQELVAHRLGVGVGRYIHFMGSAHIYESDVPRIGSSVMGDSGSRGWRMKPFFELLPSIEYLGEVEEVIREKGEIPERDRSLIERCNETGWAQALALIEAAAVMKNEGAIREWHGNVLDAAHMASLVGMQGGVGGR